jgi:CBS domain
MEAQGNHTDFTRIESGEGLPPHALYCFLTVDIHESASSGHRRAGEPTPISTGRQPVRAEAMAQQLLACQPQHSLEQAERTMRNAWVRRLPVVDDRGALIGMLSLADIAREAAAEQSQAKRQVTEVNDTLAAICAAGQLLGAFRAAV